MSPPTFRWRETEDYRVLKSIVDLDGDTPCYIPGVGEVSVRAVKLAGRGDAFLDAFAKSLDEALNGALESRSDGWGDEAATAGDASSWEPDTQPPTDLEAVDQEAVEEAVESPEPNPEPTAENVEEVVREVWARLKAEGA